MAKITKKQAKEISVVLQHTAEGLLNATTGGLSDFVATKSSAAATGITLMGIANLFGTAGTGTAISALSGAAARAAMIKWLGFGSTIVGTALVIPAIIAGGGWLGWRLIKGPQRNPEDLTQTEAKIFHLCWSFSAVMRKKAKGKAASVLLPPQDVSQLHALRESLEKYLRYGCRKSRHVRKRTVTNLKDLSKWLDNL